MHISSCTMQRYERLDTPKKRSLTQTQCAGVDNHNSKSDFFCHFDSPTWKQPRHKKSLLVPHHISPPVLPTTLQLMNRRIIQLMRSIISVQLPYLAIATSRFVAAVMLRGSHTNLLHRRAISRSLLHEPTPPDAKPDDATKCEK